MPNYRRYRRAGGLYSFTVVSQKRRPILCDPNIRCALRQAITHVRVELPFSIRAWVLMPDHLHCLWALPEGDNDYSKRWGKIKRYVSQRCGDEYRDANNSLSRIKRRESSIWQRRFWEHAIRDDRDYNAHVDYMHYNPVKHGLVGVVRDWPFSSFHRWVRTGAYPLDWGGCASACGDVAVGE